MILVDTCVWIDHFHQTEPDLVDLLESSDVCTHPMVIGELELGTLQDRAQVLELLSALPTTMPAAAQEVLVFVDRQRLFGRGLSLVDAHLLTTARINPGVSIWTRDKRLRTAAAAVGVAAAGLHGGTGTRT